MERECDLRKDFWAEMESHGSTIQEFDGSKSMAEVLVCRFQCRQNNVPETQEELVDQRKRLDETKAGQLMVSHFNRKIVDAENKIKELREKKVSGVSEDIFEVRRLEKRRGSLLEQRRVLHKKPGEEMAQQIEGERKRARSMREFSVLVQL